MQDKLEYIKSPSEISFATICSEPVLFGNQLFEDKPLFTTINSKPKTIPIRHTMTIWYHIIPRDTTFDDIFRILGFM